MLLPASAVLLAPALLLLLKSRRGSATGAAAAAATGDADRNIHASAEAPGSARGEASSSCIAALLPYASLCCCCWARATTAGLGGAGDTRLGVGDATRRGVGLRAVEGGEGGGSDMAAMPEMLLPGDAGLDGGPGSKQKKEGIHAAGDK